MDAQKTTSTGEFLYASILDRMNHPEQFKNPDPTVNSDSVVNFIRSNSTDIGKVIKHLTDKYGEDLSGLPVGSADRENAWQVLQLVQKNVDRGSNPENGVAVSRLIQTMENARRA